MFCSDDMFIVIAIHTAVTKLKIKLRQKGPGEHKKKLKESNQGSPTYVRLQFYHYTMVLLVTHLP